MEASSQSGSGSSIRQHTSADVDVCCGMKRIEAPSQSGSGSRRMGGVRSFSHLAEKDLVISFEKTKNEFSFFSLFYRVKISFFPMTDRFLPLRKL
jgi:hypothetical protein